LSILDSASRREFNSPIVMPKMVFARTSRLQLHLARLNKRKPAGSLLGTIGMSRYCKKDRLKT
jgi:hypothetical protein